MLALLLAVQMLEPLPVTAPPDYDPHGIGAAVAVYAVGAGLDLWSTEYALARGGVEANPLMRGSFGKRLAIKAAQVSLLSAIDAGLYALIETRVHARFMRWLARLGYLAAHAWLAWHNYRAVR